VKKVYRKPFQAKRSLFKSGVKAAECAEGRFRLGLAMLDVPNRTHSQSARSRMRLVGEHLLQSLSVMRQKQAVVVFRLARRKFPHDTLIK
jgi:hypothetical protein